MLGEVLNIAFYTRNTRAVRLVSGSDSCTSFYVFHAQATQVDEADEEEKDVVEKETEKELKGKKIAVSSLNLRGYVHEETWVSILQVQKFVNPFRAVSEKHEKNLLTSFRKKSCQHSVGLMAPASPPSAG